MNLLILVSILSNSFVYSLISKAPYLRNSSRPLVLAHRGDSGAFPEHTYAAYSSAYVQGADFVELDI